MRRHLLLSASILLAFGCSSEAAHDETDSLSAAFADGRAEIARHGQACVSAVAMPMVLEDLDRHVVAMDGVMERIDGGMHQMSACSADELGRIAGSMTDVRQQLGAHRERILAISDLGEAQRDCSRYTSMVSGAFGSIRYGMDGMSCAMR